MNLRFPILSMTLVLLSIGMASAVTIDFVSVGNPGNASNDTGYGRVDNTYLIGKYEITNAQWREFLNAKARIRDPYGLYNTYMPGIERNGLGTLDNPYNYTAKNSDNNWDNRPVSLISFWDAARFCNWLHNGQGNSDTESGAYINIGDQFTFARQPDAKYFIPTGHEWYKAAYYDPNKSGGTGYWSYATKSNTMPNNGNPEGDTGNTANFNDGNYTIDSPYYTTPVGYFIQSEGPYGTYDQEGNVMEWIEWGYFMDSRMVMGGDWGSNLADWHIPGIITFQTIGESANLGFRIASVPEPSSITLLVCGAIAGLIWRRRSMQNHCNTI